MDDLISRQNAIELIKNYCENGCDIAEDNWCPSCQREKFIELLKALPSAQQWISCSERLPMNKDDYIITVKDKSLTWTDYVEWSADYHWWGYDDDMVIAWMPLPEPYKGE